jgi:tetratricopeptide (TPR) repeat protein
LVLIAVLGPIIATPSVPVGGPFIDDDAISDLAELPLQQLSEREAVLQDEVAAGSTDPRTYRHLAACVYVRFVRGMQEEMDRSWSDRSRGNEMASYEEMEKQLASELRSILQLWLDRAADSAEPYVLMAQVLGDAPEADALIDRAIELYPDDIRAVTFKVWQLNEDGSPGAGGELLQSFIDRNPDNGGGYAALAGFYRSQGQEQQADLVLERWLTRLPEDQNALMAQIMWRGEALASEQVLDLLDRVLAGETLPDEVVRICHYLGRSRSAALAESCLRRVLGKAKESGDAELTGEASIELAALLVDNENWQDADPLLATITTLDADPYRIAHLALTLAEASRCQAALSLVPGDPASGHESRPEVGSTITRVHALCDPSTTTAGSLKDMLLTADPVELMDTVYWITEHLTLPEVEEIIVARVEVEPEAAAGLWRFMAVAAMEDDSDTALAYLEAWLLADPYDPEPAETLTLLLRSKEAYDLAVDSCREAIRRDPTSVYHRVELVELLIKTGQYEQASAAAESVLSDERLGDAVFVGHRLEALVALAQGRVDEALAAFRRYFSDERRARTRIASDDYDYSEYAKVLDELGLHDELARFMSDEYDRLPERQRKSLDRDEFLARSFRTLDQNELALTYADRLVARSPDDEDAVILRGEILFELGRWEEAQRSFRRALELDPSGTDARRRLAEIAQADGRHEEIVALLTPLAENRGFYDSDLVLMLSSAYMELDRPGEALPILEAEFESEESDYDVAYALGQLYVLLERPADARKAYARFLELTTRYDTDEGGSCMCRCDLVDKRAEVKEFMAATVSPPP